MSPTAYWPVPSLMTSLRKAGWGEMSGPAWGGIRSTLAGLEAALPHRSGEGLVTVDQIAAGAGLSTRWTARCLTLLEDLGVIEWRRGGAIAGRPVPSFIRLVKQRLVDLIHAARPLRAAALEAKRTETNRRIAHLRFVMRYRRRSAQVELGARLSSPSGEGLPSASPPVVDKYVPPICAHGGDGGTLASGQLRCPQCRRATS